VAYCQSKWWQKVWCILCQTLYDDTRVGVTQCQYVLVGERLGASLCQSLHDSRDRFLSHLETGLCSFGHSAHNLDTLIMEIPSFFRKGVKRCGGVGG
jgi:hypothetical protein